MEFFTMHIRPERVPSPQSSVSFTEQAGYVPTEVLIRDMMEAGERLVEARRARFDTYGNEEPEVDPTRGDLDLAELTDLAEKAREGVRRFVSRRDAKKAEELEKVKAAAAELERLAEVGRKAEAAQGSGGA